MNRKKIREILQKVAEASGFDSVGDKVKPNYNEELTEARRGTDPGFFTRHPYLGTFGAAVGGGYIGSHLDNALGNKSRILGLAGTALGTTYGVGHLFHKRLDWKHGLNHHLTPEETKYIADRTDENGDGPERLPYDSAAMSTLGGLGVGAGFAGVANRHMHDAYELAHKIDSGRGTKADLERFNHHLGRSNLLNRIGNAATIAGLGGAVYHGLKGGEDSDQHKYLKFREQMAKDLANES